MVLVMNKYFNFDYVWLFACLILMFFVGLQLVGLVQLLYVVVVFGVWFAGDQFLNSDTVGLSDRLFALFAMFFVITNKEKLGKLWRVVRYGEEL